MAFDVLRVPAEGPPSRATTSWSEHAWPMGASGRGVPSRPASRRRHTAHALSSATGLTITSIEMRCTDRHSRFQLTWGLAIPEPPWGSGGRNRLHGCHPSEVLPPDGGDISASGSPGRALRGGHGTPACRGARMGGRSSSTQVEWPGPRRREEGLGRSQGRQARREAARGARGGAGAIPGEAGAEGGQARRARGGAGPVPGGAGRGGGQARGARGGAGAIPGEAGAEGGGTRGREEGPGAIPGGAGARRNAILFNNPVTRPCASPAMMSLRAWALPGSGRPEESFKHERNRTHGGRQDRVGRHDARGTQQGHGVGQDPRQPDQQQAQSPTGTTTSSLPPRTWTRSGPRIRTSTTSTSPWTRRTPWPNRPMESPNSVTVHPPEP